MRNFYLYNLEEGNICLENKKSFTKEEFHVFYTNYLEYTKTNSKFNFIGYLIEYYEFYWPGSHSFLAVLPENIMNFKEYGTT